MTQSGYSRSITGVRAERVRPVVPAPVRTAGYVMYWMQKAQRVAHNPALGLAVELALQMRAPLLVVFVLAPYPRAEEPHYRFMLRGLAETAEELRRRGAAFRILRGIPEEALAEPYRRAGVLVSDEPRLGIEAGWRRNLRALVPDGPAWLAVETEAVVPPGLASDRDEWSAYTFRKKHALHLRRFLEPDPAPDWTVSAPGESPDPEESCFGEAGPAADASPGAATPAPAGVAEAGGAAALRTLRGFIGSGALERYSRDRNDPALDVRSGLSPYLHFGQLSPVHAALEVLASGVPCGEFIEQLVVRRELAANFALRNPGCDRYVHAVPEWARRTLEEAEGRIDRYTDEELASARTDDPYWNAAQMEMLLTGTMHGYMRMYWGKRLIAWRRSPEQAFDLAVRLNDRYMLDGRDPNGYAGIAWCFGKHDRPWPRRPLYGAVRTMTASGLRRKFDMDSYTSRIGKLYSMRNPKEERCSTR